MSKKSRLAKIEQKTGKKDTPVIIVVWNDNGEPDPDQVVNVGGTLMTFAEYERRHPDHESITLTWDDIGDE